MTPLWNALFMSAAPVAVKITITKIKNPVKETNPPRAVFNRWLVDMADKALTNSILQSFLGHNFFVFIYVFKIYVCGRGDSGWVEVLSHSGSKVDILDESTKGYFAKYGLILCALNMEIQSRYYANTNIPYRPKTKAHY